MPENSPVPKRPLPVDEFLVEIIANFAVEQNLVIAAAPGSGKTTRLPPHLLAATTGKVIVLEPRKVAVVGAAQRVSEEMGWTVGKEVGYQVRFHNVTGPETRLIFMTDGLFLRKMMADSALDGISAVVLDEFHERSRDTDVILGLIKELQELETPIKIIVMSATLDLEKVLAFLPNAKLISVPGTVQSLRIIHSDTPVMLDINSKFYERMEAAIKRAWAEGQRDILVFLPGTGEIRRLEEGLAQWAVQKDCEIVPVHGSLSLADQRRAVRPDDLGLSASGRQRRVILATNIAESSVTVNGVDTVVDSGLARQSIFNDQLGINSLAVRKISRASADQRAGRAARQFPGLCIRLWTTHDEASMPAHDQPEILRSNLSETLLILSKQGIRSFDTFAWFDRPTAQSLDLAISRLKALGAFTDDNRLTAIGSRLLAIPCEIRLARILIEAQRLNAVPIASLMVAMLEERDFLRGDYDSEHAHGDCDIAYGLDLLRSESTGQMPGHRRIHSSKRIFDVAKDLARAMGYRDFSPRALADFDSAVVTKLLLAAFPDRICRRRQNSDRALMIGGRGVKLSRHSVVRAPEFFLAVDLVDTGTSPEITVSIASGLNRQLIEQYFPDRIKRIAETKFDEGKSRLIAQACHWIDDLPLEDPRPVPLDAREVEKLLPEILLQNFELVLNADHRLRSTWTRLNFLRNAAAKLPEQQRTTTEEFFSQQTFAAWKRTCCEGIALGERNLDALGNKDLNGIFVTNLPSPIREMIQRELPERLSVPSGSSIQIEYGDNAQASVEVRLQEVFGWEKTPAILFGTVPIAMHLLGPNFRPVQITTNLASFWDTGYALVRKELRARYPKHQWPEDPRKGVPEAKGRGRRS